MVAFRVGDVVQPLPSYPYEARVVEPPVGSTYPFDDEAVFIRDIGGPGSGWHRTKNLRLLRRPVQVGDLLSLGPSDIAPMTILTMPEWDWEGMARIGWIHEDGTPIAPPIDPPAAATQGAGTMAVQPPERCGWCYRDRVVDGHCRSCGSKRNGGGVWQVPDAAEPCRERLMGVPTAEQFARALFETDERVTRFCDRVDDAVAPAHLPPETDWAAVGAEVMRRHEEAPRRAYARGIFGYAPETEWAADAWERAEQILDVLRRRS